MAYLEDLLADLKEKKTAEDIQNYFLSDKRGSKFVTLLEKEGRYKFAELSRYLIKRIGQDDFSNLLLRDKTLEKSLTQGLDITIGLLAQMNSLRINHLTEHLKQFSSSDQSALMLTLEHQPQALDTLREIIAKLDREDQGKIYKQVNKNNEDILTLAIKHCSGQQVKALCKDMAKLDKAYLVSLFKKENSDKHNLLMLAIKSKDYKTLSAVRQVIATFDEPDQHHIYKHKKKESYIDGWSKLHKPSYTEVNVLLLAIEHCSDQGVTDICQDITKLDKDDLANIFKQSHITGGQSYKGYTPLLLAIKCRQSVVKDLLKAIATLDKNDQAFIFQKKSRDNHSPLMLAIHNNPESIPALCELISKLDPKKQADILNFDILLEAIGKCPDQLEILFKTIANLTPTALSSMVPLEEKYKDALFASTIQQCSDKLSFVYDAVSRLEEKQQDKMHRALDSQDNAKSKWIRAAIQAHKDHHALSKTMARLDKEAQKYFLPVMPASNNIFKLLIYINRRETTFGNELFTLRKISSLFSNQDAYKRSTKVSAAQKVLKYLVDDTPATFTENEIKALHQGALRKALLDNHKKMPKKIQELINNPPSTADLEIGPGSLPPYNNWASGGNSPYFFELSEKDSEVERQRADTPVFLHPDLQGKTLHAEVAPTNTKLEPSLEQQPHQNTDLLLSLEPAPLQLPSGYEYKGPRPIDLGTPSHSNPSNSRADSPSFFTPREELQQTTKQVYPIAKNQTTIDLIKGAPAAPTHIIEEAGLEKSNTLMCNS